MPRRRDTPCSKCGELTWWNSKTSRPKDQVVCHACKVGRPSRTVSVSEQLRRMRMAAEAPRSIVCACGATFIGVGRRMYCDACQDARRRDHYRRKNRSRFGYQRAIRAFPINALGDRDRWTCWLCSEGVDPRLKGRHPGMASYDHVVPTSLGGSDEPDNLKLAHLVCNVRRGNRIEETGQVL